MKEQQHKIRIFGEKDWKYIVWCKPNYIGKKAYLQIPNKDTNTAHYFFPAIWLILKP